MPKFTQALFLLAVSAAMAQEQPCSISCPNGCVVSLAPFPHLVCATLATPAKLTQAITFLPLPDRTSADPALFGLAASASSGLAVQFTARGACTVAGAVVTEVGPGQCQIIASQSGNAAYLAAPDVVQTFAIAGLPSPPVVPASVAVVPCSTLTKTSPPVSIAVLVLPNGRDCIAGSWGVLLSDGTILAGVPVRDIQPGAGIMTARLEGGATVEVSLDPLVAETVPVKCDTLANSGGAKQVAVLDAAKKLCLPVALGWVGANGELLANVNPLQWWDRKPEPVTAADEADAAAVALRARLASCLNWPADGVWLDRCQFHCQNGDICIPAYRVYYDSAGDGAALLLDRIVPQPLR